mgnify:CR=1 FL=1
MYAYIKGKITCINSIFVIIEAFGIGYLINIPANAIAQLPTLGSDILLYTSFVVREHSHALFGFLTKNEEELFEILLQVTGIGPKTAMSLIGHMHYQEFVDAVKNEDIKKICKTPGIGKKTAERLLLEIGDKLKLLYEFDPSEYTVKGGNMTEGTIKDAISGLINLGYNQMNASKAVQKALDDRPNSSLAELITLALKNA